MGKNNHLLSFYILYSYPFQNSLYIIIGFAKLNNKEGNLVR